MDIKNTLARIFPTGVASDGITLSSQAEPCPAVVDVARRSDSRVSLLAEVDFKWLMAGQGWWIDPPRFHCDPSYAAGLIGLALASQSFALRASAVSMQTQVGE
ncbi:MAG: hypothetical protein ABI606_02165 [Rhodoferax sp.]